MPPASQTTTHARRKDAITRAQSSLQDPSEKDLQILNEVIAEIWEKVRAEPHTYILTGFEYRFFNYFQKRFDNDPVAKPIAERARKRYWDSMKSGVGG